MRKHAKSWLIKALIAIIALVFIFYFGYSFRSREASKMAVVNGDIITGMEYNKAYTDLVENYRRQYKDFWNDDIAKMLGLKARALDNLINERLISQEAERLGIEVTDNEIQQAILDFPAFQINGRFSLGQYQALLSRNRMTAEDFEAGLGLSLLTHKLNRFILAFMEPTEQEILDHYTFQNEAIKISYVLFYPKNYRESVTTDPTGMEAFYRENKEDYRVPEKIRCQYIIIDPKLFRDRVKVSEEEINRYYEYNIEAFSQPKKVKARHIFFKVEEGAPAEKEAAIKKKAEKVLALAREGKDFASLAKKYSDGPTKADGGDLGTFEKGEMEDKALEKVVFSLKKGEISDLVRGAGGYHIIKVEDIQEPKKKPTEEAKAEIREILIKDQSKELAHEKALNIMDQMPYDIKLSEYAPQHGYEAQETNLFSVSDPIAGIATDEKLRQALFALDIGDSSGIVEIEDKYYIFQVIEKKESFIPELDAVSIQVKAALKDQMAAEMASSKAQAFLNELREGKKWEPLAKENNLKTMETDFFKRGETIPELGSVPGLFEEAFSLNENKKYPEKILTSDKGALVIRWEERKGIDPDKFQEEKEQYRVGILQAKQRHATQLWLESLRRKADIEIVGNLN